MVALLYPNSPNANTNREYHASMHSLINTDVPVMLGPYSIRIVLFSLLLGCIFGSLFYTNIINI